jgi:hypothetical protein
VRPHGQTRTFERNRTVITIAVSVKDTSSTTVPAKLRRRVSTAAARGAHVDPLITALRSVALPVDLRPEGWRLATLRRRPCVAPRLAGEPDYEERPIRGE